jgi:hypothetical protein
VTKKSYPIIGIVCQIFGCDRRAQDSSNAPVTKGAQSNTKGSKTFQSKGPADQSNSSIPKKTYAQAASGGNPVTKGSTSPLPKSSAVAN